MRILPLLFAGLFAVPAVAQQASVAGTDGTNALGTIPCAPLSGVALTSCPAELVRRDDGKVSVRVLMPGGRTRLLYFEGGELTSADTTDKVRGKVQGGTYFIFVGESERFEVPANAVK
ncbi:MAG: hypothetical protein AB3N23_06935 [Paracoccaceae bacterium]